LRKISGIDFEDVEREPLANNDLIGRIDYAKVAAEEEAQKMQIADKEDLIEEFFELTENIRTTKVDVVAELIQERHQEAQAE